MQAQFFIFCLIEAGDNQQYAGLAEELLEEVDSVSLVSAALKLLTKELDLTPVKLTEETPIWKKVKNKRAYQQATGKKRTGVEPISTTSF